MQTLSHVSSYNKIIIFIKIIPIVLFTILNFSILTLRVHLSGHITLYHMKEKRTNFLMACSGQRHLCEWRGRRQCNRDTTVCTLDSCMRKQSRKNPRSALQNTCNSICIFELFCDFTLVLNVFNAVLNSEIQKKLGKQP